MTKPAMGLEAKSIMKVRRKMAAPSLEVFKKGLAAT